MNCVEWMSHTKLTAKRRILKLLTCNAFVDRGTAMAATRFIKQPSFMFNLKPKSNFRFSATLCSPLHATLLSSIHPRMASNGEKEQNSSFSFSSSSPQIRHDVIQDRWVIISASRGKRPSHFKSKLHVQPHAGPCAFCLHHEHECAPEIFRIPTDPALNWKVRVIQNLYPALCTKKPNSNSHDDDDDDDDNDVDGDGEAVLGYGFHDVVIETPEHCTTLSSMAPADIQLVLTAYKRRIQQLSAFPRIKYVQVFKNHGERAGASIEHSHSQIIATPFVPKTVEYRLNAAKEHFARTAECNFCCYMNKDLGPRGLSVHESSNFAAWVPFAASRPFELWIAPKKHSSHFHDITDDEINDLTCILKTVLRKLDHQLENPPYNFMIQSSPLKGLYDTKFCHWFIQIVPQLTYIGGFEMASDCYINPIFPENVASVLRNL